MRSSHKSRLNGGSVNAGRPAGTSPITATPNLVSRSPSATAIPAAIATTTGPMREMGCCAGKFKPMSFIDATA